jgi:hypothetical protein
MGRKSLIDEKLLDKIKEMAHEGFNVSEISEQLDLKKQTLSLWKHKFNIPIQSYGPREGYLKYKKFLNILDDAYNKKETVKLNQTLRDIDLHPGTAQSILKKHPKYRVVILSDRKSKYTTEDLVKYALKKGGKCLDIKYHNNNTKYKWECSEGHKWSARWNDIKNGNKWCPICARKIASDKLIKYDILHLKKYAEDKGGKCLSEKYKNYKTKYLWQCQCKNKWEATWSDIKQGRWCSVCSSINVGESNRKYNIDLLKNKAINLGGKCLSEHYKDVFSKYQWQCKKGHLWQTTWDSINRGSWCPSCSTQHSKAELEVLEWVQSQGFEAFSTRQIIKPKEIDIYVPSLNLGIEYCGLYWHSEAGGKGRNYHRDKMVSCEESGIRLITIFEDEWRDRNKQVKNFLKSVMGVHSRRVYARKCEVREVESGIAHRFLEDNHIQGKAPLKIAFGLFFENELLGVVTGNVHHRNFGEGDDFVLNRLVFKDEVQVVGGASKLIVKLRGYAKEKGFGRLISWSDSRYSQGNVYEKCGFILDSLVPPDYSYITPELERQSKQSNKKANLLKKGAVGNMSMTETELALSLGLSRLWDCGKKKYVINL